MYFKVYQIMMAPPICSASTPSSSCSSSDSSVPLSSGCVSSFSSQGKRDVVVESGVRAAGQASAGMTDAYSVVGGSNSSTSSPLFHGNMSSSLIVDHINFGTILTAGAPAAIDHSPQTHGHDERS